jgi:hypothetical protein
MLKRKERGTMRIAVTLAPEIEEVRVKALVQKPQILVSGAICGGIDHGCTHKVDRETFHVP